MIGFLRVHQGYAWPLGSVVMAGLIWCAWRVGRAWADRTEPDDEPREFCENCAQPLDGLEVTWCRECIDYFHEEQVTPDGHSWDELGPEEQADQLIAEWHDDPQDVTQPWSLLDEWWSDLDGLERECELLHMSTREQDRAWAELIEETRALCPLAVAG